MADNTTGSIQQNSQYLLAERERIVNDTDRALELERQVEELKDMYKRVHDDWQEADRSNYALRETLKSTVETVSAKLHQYGQTVGETALIEEAVKAINSELPTLCPPLRTKQSFDVTVTIVVPGIVAFDQTEAETLVCEGHYDSDVANALLHNDMTVSAALSKGEVV